MKAPKINKYAGGGTPKNAPKKMTPKEWDAYAASQKWAEYPGSAPNTRGYKSYFDTTKYKFNTDPNTGGIDPRSSEALVSGIAPTAQSLEYDYEAAKAPGKIYEAPSPGVAEGHKPVVIGTAGTYNPNTDKNYIDPSMATGLNPIRKEQYAKGGSIKAPFVKKKVDNVYFGGGTVLTDEEKKNGYQIRGGKKYDAMGKEVPMTDLQNEESTDKQQTGQAIKGAATQALGAYGSGYYAANANTGNQGEDARAKVLGGISNAGPIGSVIGGVAGIGDTVGAPIKAKTEKTNAQGKLVNEDKARNSAIVGGLLSPSKALVARGEYQGGYTDISGRGYTKHLEDVAQQQLASNNFQKEQAARQQQFAAEGGTIKGPGTGKSDSILSRVTKNGIPANSFIVPAENNGLAKKIRKEVLGDNPNKEAKFQKLNGGGESKADVAVSNGEQLFTPKEKKKIKAKLGEEIFEELAPDAEENKEEKRDGGELSAHKAKIMLHEGTANGKQITDKQRRFFGWVAGGRKADGGVVGYKDGGNIPEGTKLGKYTYKKGFWSDAQGNKLTKEYGQKYNDAYFKQTGGKSKDQLEMEADVRAANEKNSPGYYNPTKTGAQLEKIPSSKPSALASKVRTGKSTTTPSGIKMSEMGTVEPINVSRPISMEPAGELKTPSTGQDSSKGLATTNPNPPSQKKGLGDYLNKNWGSALEMGASAAQIGMGLKGLKEQRPVDKIDPLFQANVDKAQAAAKYGFSPEENALLNQQNQSALNAARFSARNYAGGNAGTAFVQERNAINEGYGNALKKAIANKSLMMDKQQYADQMALQKAQMSRNLFGDKLNAWSQRQSSAGELLGAGLSNLIGSQRYKDELAAQQERNKYNNPNI